MSNNNKIADIARNLEHRMVSLIKRITGENDFFSPKTSGSFYESYNIEDRYFYFAIQSLLLEKSNGLVVPSIKNYLDKYNHLSNVDINSPEITNEVITAFEEFNVIIDEISSKSHDELLKVAREN